MNQEREYGTDESGDLSMLELAAVGLRYRRMMVVLPLLMGLALALQAFLQQRRYVATASFYPQAAETGGSRMVSLAQQFGISLTGTPGGETPQFYADLVQSREILHQAVESSYSVPGPDGSPSRITLIEWYDVDRDPGAVQPEWLLAVKELRENLSVAAKAETGVVVLEVTMTRPDLAEQVAERLLDLLNQFNLQTRRSQAQEEVRFAGERIGEARRALIAAEDSLEAFLLRNRQFQNSPELAFEYDRRSREVGMRQQVYTSLAQAHEQSKIEAARDVPVITVISPPGGAAEPKSRGTVLRGIVGAAIGLLLALAVAFLREAVRRARLEGREEYRDLVLLKDEAWRELRRTVRRPG
jgi:uncharacterized protein involved in exopolysaccharide biosynthesis